MKIYALVSEDTVWYVGKTSQTLRQRKFGHTCKANRSSSKNIPAGVKWDIILLEETDDSISTDTERFYVDFLNPVCNLKIPGRTEEEYKNTVHYKDIVKTYRKTSRYREFANERNRKYRQRLTQV
jgi:zona occludens toxin (predicted ATPase)